MLTTPPNTTDEFHPNQLGNAYMAKKVLADVFGINFNPNMYMQDHLGGKKYPGY